MRSFINSIFLSEAWSTGRSFLNLGSGSVWYHLDTPEEIMSAVEALHIRDRERFQAPAYLLVHDNTPVMLATVDPATAHVNQAVLHGGTQADTGWSRYTSALEAKLMGNDIEEESFEPLMAEDAPEVVGSVVPGVRNPKGFLRVNSTMTQIAHTPAPKSPDEAARLIARINDLCDAVEEFADRRSNDGQHGLSLELRKAVSDARAMFPRGDADQIVGNPHTAQNCRQAIEELRDALYTAGIMVETDAAPAGEDQILDEELSEFQNAPENIRQLAAQIRDMGGNPIVYSGRAMYGKHCLGFTTDYRFEIDDIAGHLAEENGLELSDPNVDQMGRGFVAYWPWLKIGAEPKPERAAQSRLKGFSLPK